MKTVHGKEKPFNCEICDFASLYQPNLRRHQINVHKTEGEEQIQKYNQFCIVKDTACKNRCITSSIHSM